MKCPLNGPSKHWYGRLFYISVGTCNTDLDLLNEINEMINRYKYGTTLIRTCVTIHYTIYDITCVWGWRSEISVNNNILAP